MDDGSYTDIKRIYGRSLEERRGGINRRYILGEKK